MFKKVKKFFAAWVMGALFPFSLKNLNVDAVFFGAGFQKFRFFKCKIWESIYMKFSDFLVSPKKNKWNKVKNKWKK